MTKLPMKIFTSDLIPTLMNFSSQISIRGLGKLIKAKKIACLNILMILGKLCWKNFVNIIKKELFSKSILSL